MYRTEAIEEVSRLTDRLQRDISSKDSYSFSCSDIAKDIARIFLKHGHEPTILDIRGAQIDTYGHRDALSPTRFGGRLLWCRHFVCEESGVIYDPINSSPVEQSAYGPETFMNELSPVVFYIYASLDLRDFVGS